MNNQGAYTDWICVLREFSDIYGSGFDGGSPEIRRHQRRVYEEIGKLFHSDPEITVRPPEQKPVVANLAYAIDLACAGPFARLAQAVTRQSECLTWEWGYARLPAALARNYAYSELAGPRGPVRSERLILGVVLFAPNTAYPRHRHPGIEESYVSLAGAWSQNDAAVYGPGSMILNRQGKAHSISVGDHDPCLLAYAWLGPAGRLAEPDMTFYRCDEGD